MALPSGYTPLQYIVSTTETFLRLNTEFGQAGTTSFSITYESTSTTGALLGGSVQGETNGSTYWECFIGGRGGTFYYRDDDDSYSWGGAFKANVRQTVICNPGRSIVIDGTTHSLSDIIGWGNLYILYSKYFNATTNKTYFNGKVYALTVSNYTFTPALRQSDNTAGFYCSNGTFYASGGNAAFIAGPALQYQITVNINDTSYGTVTGAGLHDADSTVTLVATPKTNYRFVNWTIDGQSVSTNPTYTFTCTKAVTIQANFTISGYVVSGTSSPMSGGTISGIGTITAGQNATLTAIPSLGYSFSKFIINGVTQISTNPYTFKPTGDTAVVAEFTKNTYTLSYSTTRGSAPSPVPNVWDLTRQMLAPIDAAGYFFIDWYYDSTFAIRAKIGDIITKNTTIYAKWGASVASGDRIKTDDMDNVPNNWYQSLNNIINNFGDIAYETPIPSEMMPEVEEGNDADAYDINYLIDKIEELQADPILGENAIDLTLGTDDINLYEYVPTDRAVGGKIDENTRQKVQTTMYRLGLIQCRNQATNVNSCNQQHTVPAYGTNNFKAAYGTNNFKAAYGTNNYAAGYSSYFADYAGCNQSGCFQCYVSDTCSNNGCYQNAGAFGCTGYGSYYCSNCSNLSCYEGGTYVAESGCSDYHAATGCSDFHAATGCTDYHAPYDTYSIIACNFQQTVDILCNNVSLPRAARTDIDKNRH